MKKYIFILLLLSGCGFSPLYLSKTLDADAAKISIAPINGTLGQELRNNLEHRFNPSGIASEKPYKLTIILTEAEVSRQGIRQDDTATRITISLTATYKLFFKDTLVLEDKSVFLSSYNILNDPYSSYVSHQKTQNNLNDLIADDIALRIGLYLKDNKWQN